MVINKTITVDVNSHAVSPVSNFGFASAANEGSTHKKAPNVHNKNVLLKV